MRHWTCVNLRGRAKRKDGESEKERERERDTVRERERETVRERGTNESQPLDYIDPSSREFLVDHPSLVVL